jgi:hypothetical protein
MAPVFKGEPEFDFSGIFYFAARNSKTILPRHPTSSLQNPNGLGS